MTEVRIGAGGWAYFKVPGIDPLTAYSKAFDFVEVNSTFYEFPAMRVVESWRKRVPPSFEFAVRCHKDLTHTYKFEPGEESFRVFSRMTSVCDALKARILHLETPTTMEFTASKLKSIRDFLNSADTKGIRLVWEVRKRVDETYSPEVLKILQDFNIAHCVDISKGEKPTVQSDLLYTRLFGLGTHNIYQYTDEELRNIQEKSVGEGFEKAFLCFHGVRMYKDAARLKVFEKTGRFPRATKSVGLASLEEVLREDVRLPAAKGELVAQQGWKVIDITPDKRIRVSLLLEQLPEGSYASITQILETLRQANLKIV